MNEYTVRKLAKLAGISVRALHHYDAIGLLKPSKRTDAGYRLYRDKDLLKLQQILFYRELEFPLNKIRSVMNKKGFDMIQALENHRKMLLERTNRTETLLKTIDRTITSLKEENHMLKDKDLYEGFTKEETKKLKGYEKEAAQIYDPEIVAESQRRVRKMSKEQWNAVKKQGDDATRLLAALSDRDPSDPEVQKAVEMHHAWIENFYPCPPAMYRSLGAGYAQDPRFRAFYDKYKKNLADFINAAINAYCEKAEGR